jgi:hypothetical protein
VANACACDSIGGAFTCRRAFGLRRAFDHGDFAPITQLVSAGTALVATVKFSPQTFRVHREVVRILKTKDVQDLVLARGNEVIANMPEEFAAQLKRDVPHYRNFIAASGIEV